MGFTTLTDTAAVAIALNGSLSGAIALRGATPVGLQMSAGWDTAAVTFQVSTDGSTYQDAYTSAGVEISVTAVAAHYVVLPATLLPGAGWVKVRSGTSASPVNQTAARALTLVLRGV